MRPRALLVEPWRFHMTGGSLPWSRRSCWKVVEKDEIFFFLTFFWNWRRVFINRPFFLIQLASESRHTIKSSISARRLYKAARARSIDSLSDKSGVHKFMRIRCIIDAPRVPNQAELFQ